MSIEFLDHTADLGIRVTASNVESLYAQAATAMMTALVEDPASITASGTDTDTIPILLIAPTAEDLLYDWLSEILYRFDGEQFLCASVRDMMLAGVSPTDGECTLQATLVGERFDRTRHQPRREIKAITYCQMTISRNPATGEWSATWVVDL